MSEDAIVATDARVKVMRSYDYCHFEISLGTDQPVTNKDVDDLRKEAQRLADKAVEQYKIAKSDALWQASSIDELRRLKLDVKVIKENFPKSEWTPEQKAKVKALEDTIFRQSQPYDYQDDWDW